MTKSYFSLNTNPFGKPKSKKKKFTPHERAMLWDNNTKTCHICHKRIINFTECEFDHIRAYSKGGKTVALSHRACNRMKSNKPLQKVQKHMGFKVTKKTTMKKKVKSKRKSKSKNMFGTFLYKKPPSYFSKKRKQPKSYFDR